MVVIPVGGLVFVAVERVLASVNPLPAWLWFWAIMVWFALMSVVLSRVDIVDETIRVHNPISTVRIPINEARVMAKPACRFCLGLVRIDTPLQTVRCWGLSVRRFTTGPDDVAPFCHQVGELGGRVAP
ncbi:MAG: hypothetical protein ACK5RL_07030 [Acidimicrobiales bacterium]